MPSDRASKRADPSLATLQLVMAEGKALVEAASAGTVSARTQNRFDRHVDKAIANIEEAMDHIVAAGVAADSDAGR